jgi:hypothetical protein
MPPCQPLLPLVDCFGPLGFWSFGCGLCKTSWFTLVVGFTLFVYGFLLCGGIYFWGYVYCHMLKL